MKKGIGQKGEKVGNEKNRTCAIYHAKYCFRRKRVC